MSRNGYDSPAYVETIVHSSDHVNANQQTQAIHYAAPKVRLSYLEKMRKHYPNSNSMAAGNILLMASAMHMAWGLWQIASTNQSWSMGLSTSIHLFILYSWFLTVIVGSVVGAILVNIWKKTILYAICGSILTISGILYIAGNEDYLAILFGRILGGIAHGILYVTIVSHYGENTAAEMRGYLISAIGVIFSSTAVIIALLTLYKNEIFDISYSDRLTGILIIIWSIIGLAVNYFLTVESVPFLLIRDQEQEAVQALMKLRSESTETPTIQNELEDLRQMVNQAKQENQNIFNNGNVRPLLLVILLKLQAFLTNNSIINSLLITVVQVTLVGGTATTFVAPVFLTSFRLLAGLIRLIAGDLVTRKWYLTPSGIVSGILLGAFGIIVMNVNLENGFLVILVWFQFMAGFGIDSMSHVITSEAFAINKKAWSIAFATSIENVLQLVAIIVMYYLTVTVTTIYVILLGSAILIALLAVTIHFLLPETLNLSIKQCRDVHRSLKHRSTTHSHIVSQTYS